MGKNNYDFKEVGLPSGFRAELMQRSKESTNSVAAGIAATHNGPFLERKQTRLTESRMIRIILPKAMSWVRGSARPERRAAFREVGS